MSKEPVTQITFERSTTIWMAFVCAISLLVMIGWLFNLPILASLRPEFIPMAPSTALIFLGLSGTWLIQRVFQGRHGMRIIVQACLLGMLIIVLILTFRTFTGYGLNLEELLSPNPPLFGLELSSRMSPLTSLGFLLAIPAFLLMTGREPGKRNKSAAAGISLIVLILSGLNILGYLYGAPPFYGGTLTPVAVTTAFSFLFLSLGLLMTAGPTCWPVRMFVGPSLQAHLMGAFIPASIVIALLQGFLSTDSAPWIVNPALRVAVAVLVATLIVFLIISLIANNLSKEIEHSNQARMKAESALNHSEARFRTLAETASDAIINIDRDGTVVFWNRAAETIFGYSAGEVIGKPLDRVIPEEFRAAHRQGLQRVVATGETQIIGKTVEIAGLRKDGREFPLALSLASWQEAGDVFFTGIVHDISERKQAEKALHETEERFRLLFEHAAVGVALLDTKTGHYLDINQKYCDFLGYTKAEMLNLSFQDVTYPDNVQENIEDNALLLSGEFREFSIEKRYVRKDGQIVWGELTASPLWAAGDETSDYVHIAVVQDITERKRSEEEIRSLSLTDELTGLYNRRGFTLLAEQEVKQAHREKRSMLLFFGDVDKLKAINDTLGHDYGDLALKEASAILKETFREADILARIGGDEFLILAVDASVESAETIINRLQAAVEAHNQLGVEPYHLELSVGVALIRSS